MSFRSFAHLQAGRKAKQAKAAQSGPNADDSGQSSPKSGDGLSPIKPGPDVPPLIGPIILLVASFGCVVIAVLLMVSS